MEQFFVIILVCAFWVSPKGSLTLEELSILLLEYLAIGVDSLDILTVLDEVTQKAIDQPLFGDAVICVIFYSTVFKRSNHNQIFSILVLVAASCSELVWSPSPLYAPSEAKLCKIASEVNRWQLVLI